MGLKKAQKQGRDDNTRRRTILLQKNLGKERPEDYSTYVFFLAAWQQTHKDIR